MILYEDPQCPFCRQFEELQRAGAHGRPRGWLPRRRIPDALLPRHRVGEGRQRSRSRGRGRPLRPTPPGIVLGAASRGKRRLHHRGSSTNRGRRWIDRVGLRRRACGKRAMRSGCCAGRICTKYRILRAHQRRGWMAIRSTPACFSTHPRWRGGSVPSPEGRTAFCADGPLQVRRQPTPADAVDRTRATLQPTPLDPDGATLGIADGRIERIHEKLLSIPAIPGLAKPRRA